MKLSFKSNVNVAFYAAHCFFSKISTHQWNQALDSSAAKIPKNILFFFAFIFIKKNFVGKNLFIIDTPNLKG
jgi:hypothetical protein